MKELSIEEKAKAYDEALEGIRGYIKSLKNVHDGIWSAKDIENHLSKYFPELAESEDERIRKTLIEYFNAYPKDYYGELKKSHILAWLEKQGEQKANYTTIVETGDGGIRALVTKELPTNGCDDKQKPADKVVPKFKVGDWVFIEEVKGYKNGPFQIKAVDSFGYSFDEYHTIPFMYEDLLSKWTIQDAKDGDVLAEDTCTFIIKKLNDDLSAEIYCCLYDDGDFELNFNLGFDDTCTYPATKEQRDLLFQKIKEVGYEWDAEKKELKKFDFSKPIKYNSNPPSIVKEPAWTEDDENILNDMKDTIKECWNGDTRDILLDWFETIKQRIRGGG